MGRLVGYACVSTAEQGLQLQLDALNKAGCVKVFEDKASGARAERPGLDACIAALEPGNTLVVWRLDRLGRSMPHLVSLVAELLGKGIGFRSLQDGAIDTTRRHRKVCTQNYVKQSQGSQDRPGLRRLDSHRIEVERAGVDAFSSA